MQRTNVYLSDAQLAALRALADARGQAVAELVREAIDAWLGEHGVRPVSTDDWEQRFDELLARRGRIAGEQGFQSEEVERDVLDAVREVRRTRAARRR